MSFLLDSRSVAVLLIRLSLALYLASAGLALVTGNIGGPDPAWLPTATFGPAAPLLGVLFLVAGALLFVGVATTITSIVVAALLIVILVAWLMANPLHNTMNHLMPFMAAALVTFAAARDRFRFDEATRASLVVLFARLFLGSIFIAQGTRSMMKRGLVGFARKVYVEPLAGSWVPEPLLWVAGLTNPIIQVTTGILLLLGLRTRFAATVMGAFLVSIFFGHLLSDPFDRGDSPHAYAMANFLIAVVILWLHSRGDRFSLDALGASRKLPAAVLAVLLLGGCASGRQDVDSLVADAHAHMGSQRFQNVPRAVAERRMRNALANAAALDPGAASVLAMQALVQLHFDLDRDGALKSFERALALAPNDAKTRFEYAQLLGALGRFDQALAESTRAEELQPDLRLQSGRLLYMAGRYDEVLKRFATPPADRRARAITHFYRGLALEQRGRVS
ncbi:MAG TPA: tetratricopeptide repeat protein, partial [Thermoanaerobaculia bacterium]|nr:tetratricopeptide repeat protein [Thermoanaerobaculia bacterium]